ncbi:MAG: hypothetical protein KJO31_10795 [Gammaproteobacteria bacterium]|nr:hypothetical protein [Gammaproteobacteria bacterium]
MLNPTLLRDAERIVRLTMIVVLLTAGISKFFSAGGFFAYYSALFQGDLRINLPAALVNAYLAIIPFAEVGIGLLLISHRFRWIAIHVWFAFMLSLLVGHYVLQEWSSVNQMLDYVFLGVLCLVLPAHPSWISRDTG